MADESIDPANTDSKIIQGVSSSRSNSRSGSGRSRSNSSSRSRNSSRSSVAEVDADPSKRRKIRLRSSGSKTGMSKSEKSRRRLNWLKAIVFGIYGFLMLMAMSKLQNDALWQSLFYNAIALLFLLALTKIKGEKSKNFFKIAPLWWRAHIGILVVQALLVLWLGDEIGGKKDDVPAVEMRESTKPVTEKYVPGDEPE